MRTQSKCGRAVLAALLATNVGCYSSWDMTPKALAPIHDFHESDRVRLTDVDGSRFTFDKTSQLSFEGQGTDGAFEKFTSITIGGPTFVGTTPDSRTLAVDLSQVRAVHVKRWSLWKTTALVSAITFGALVTIAIIVLAAAPHNSGGCDPDFGC
jgi:hypothetical protein